MWVIKNDELYHYGIKGMKWKNHKYGQMSAAEGRAAEARYRQLEGMAQQTVQGKYGNGSERQEHLGRNYYDTQSMVNYHMKGRDINPGNYATSGETSKEYSERKAKEFSEKVRNEAGSRKTKSKSKSESESVSVSKKESGDGKSKAYNRGYALVKKLLGKRKR